MSSEQPPLWRYIPSVQHTAPAEPTGETVRRGVRDLLHRLRPAKRSGGTAGVQKELCSVPQRLLDLAAPAPTWDEALNALDGALRPWPDSADPGPGVQVVIGAPGSGTAPVVARWAQARDWRLIAAPSPEQILTGGGDWLAHVKEKPDTPLALPRLERCYLRHHDGLTLLQRLLDWLSTNRPRCLIGCDSWGGAYLGKALQLEAVLPSGLTLEPFDGLRFQRWFGALGTRSQEEGFRFCRADNGEPVLPPEGEPEFPGPDRNRRPGGEGRDQVSDFLQHLAGRSRGIPGIGWAIWRQSLHVTRDDEGAGRVEDAPVGGRSHTIWVRPWSGLALPSLPPGAGTPEAFVLHTLLLHAGLPGPLLSELLPLRGSQIVQSLHRLQAAGLLVEEAGVWQVTALGYPAVRQHLRSEGYLVDAL